MAATTPQKMNGEHTATAFSYAQAAKGRSPSVPDTTLDTEKPSPKRTASEGHMPSETESRKSASEVASPEKPETSKSSVPSSPDYGTASTSTLPKEDDPFSPRNGSSDSTWEKQSENSQNGSKGNDRADADKQQDELVSWSDDAPALPTLKEAPPPIVNFWQQRKEAQEAKQKANKLLSSTSGKAVDANVGNTNGSKTPSEIKKHDTQRKAKGNTSQLDPNAALSGMKDGNKAADNKMRNVDDGKMSTRTARVAEPQKATTAITAPLPPPADAMSWPTPDTAQDEERKKAQERAGKAEKDKSNGPVLKSHGKEKWTPIPFVPSAVFNTPIPQIRRGGGGRPSRGGRDAGTGRGGTIDASSDDMGRLGAYSGSANQPATSATDRGRADQTASKNPSVGTKFKRSASAGPPTIRDQRKGGVSPSTEKRKEQYTNGFKPSSNQLISATKAQGTPVGTDGSEGFAANPSSMLLANASGPLSAQNTPVNDEAADRRQSVHMDTYNFPRSTGSDRRSEGPRPFDLPRDFAGAVPLRERGDGRPERNRGGYRGRGNGSYGFSNQPHVNGNGYANGNSTQHQVPTMQPAKSHSSHERHERHPSYTQGSASSSHTHPRSFRSNSRSQSIPHSAPYGRYPNGQFPAAPHLANIQTDIANAYGYQPGNQGTMSAVPYSPYADQVTLYGMVSMQMEYYFSLDNLCKDMFLRKHMDSQGFVFLSVLANFNRIRQLTQDMELIKLVCLNSVNIEIRTGEDGIDRLRKKEGWQQWVLSMEERDPSAQNEGSSRMHQPRIAQSPMFAVPYGFDEMLETPASYTSQPHMAEHKQQDGISASMYLPNGIGPTANEKPSVASTTQTPNPATVPDFSPAGPVPTNGRGFSPIEPHVHSASSFSDEQVESLMIVVRKPANTSAALPPPFHSASSRTFSNGSIDGRTITDELARFEERQPRPTVNGTTGPQLNEFNMAQRARSPLPVGSPKRQATSNASPVFWVKDKETPIDSLPSDLTHESYNGFRINALQQRELSGPGACHRDMDILYQFWSHFLIRNFNTRMYEEFCQTAFEDANQRDSKVGLQNLVQYYDASMLGQKLMTDGISRDYVNLVKNEGTGAERPAFDKLRSAWRNGATNMKNRKKIGDFLDNELKARLER